MDILKLNAEGLREITLPNKEKRITYELVEALECCHQAALGGKSHAIYRPSPHTSKQLQRELEERGIKVRIISQAGDIQMDWGEDELS